MPIDNVFGYAPRRLQELQISPLFETLIQDELPRRDSILDRMGVKVVIVLEKEQLKISLNQLVTSKKLLGIDIETYPLPEFIEDHEAGLVPRKSVIRLIQIYDGVDTVFIFDLLKLGMSTLPDIIWGQPMVAHNALFELKHLLHNGSAPLKLGCTLLADRVINGNRSKLRKDLGLSASAGLKDVSKEFLSLDISKEMQVSDWAQPDLSEEQIEYAALDAVLPVKIFQMQQVILKKQNLIRPYEILRDAQRAVAQMELNGIGFNVDKHKELIVEWEYESKRLCEEISAFLGITINLNSSKQLGAWLTTTLKEEDLESWIKTNGGKLSTSTPTFKLKEHMHTIFPKIVEYRQVAKKISSFGEGLYKFIEVPNRRLFASFSLGTTATGRMASQKPNLQNMPRAAFRDLFCARDGYTLIGLDYSQQELRVASLVAKDKELLQIYEQGGDVHANTAASLLNIPKNSVTKTQRQLAKAVAFGLLYGQGAKGLAVYAKQQYGVEMTEQEAEVHRSAFFKTYYGLRAWQKETGNLVKITGKIRTQCGRVRDFSRELEGYRFTAALNHPIQGAAAEITLRAITRLTPLLNEKCRLVNVIHDEILLEVVEEEAEEVASKVVKEMELAFLDIFPEAGSYLKGLVEAKMGKNWEETK